MKIQKINQSSIYNNKDIKKYFNRISYEDIKVESYILEGDFYLDSYNYFPITKNNFYTFPKFFDWQNKSNDFYKKEYQNNFFKNKLNFKEISNAFVLGSSPGNNYYRNIYTFLCRLFFINDKEVSIAIHRKTPNNIRNFILYVLSFRKIKLKKFIYLDDDLYLFKNSQIPSFLDFKSTIKIYEKMFPVTRNKSQFFYISRRNAKWRVLVNEADFLEYLRKHDFQIIDFENLSIVNQIKLIQSATKIIAPNGSGLTNIIFANRNIQIIEIRKKIIYTKEYLSLYNKYKKISDYKKNKHVFFDATIVNNDRLDSIESTNIPSIINKGFLSRNPYYKNIIVKEKDFKNLISNFASSQLSQK